MKLTDPQAQILSDTHRFRVINCGRRFGKTTLAIEEIKCLGLSRKARICYIAPTIQQARDIAWSMMLEDYRPVIVKAVESPSREITISNLKGTTSLIQLRGWEAIETLRGQQFDFIVIDEVASMRNFWLNWQEVIRPTLTDTRGSVMFISTPKGFNHFYDLYNLESTDSDYKSFHFTSYDNPYLPVEELDKAKQELPEDRFSQEYMADFRKTEGLVYKEFNRELHVTEKNPSSTTETILGIDFGYTNPAGILPIRVDGDSNFWIGEEWYKQGQTTEQIAEQALRYRSTKCYPDPAEPDRIEILRKAGLNCREVNKDIVAGIDHIRELFKQGRIHIHPDCKNLIMELETYRYPDKKPDQNEPEKPIKENDHLLDSLRYALYTNQPVIPEQKDWIFEQRGTYFEA
jgi:PBSX family phage terminase large subunit